MSFIDKNQLKKEFEDSKEKGYLTDAFAVSAMRIACRYMTHSKWEKVSHADKDEIVSIFLEKFSSKWNARRIADVLCEMHSDRSKQAIWKAIKHEHLKIDGLIITDPRTMVNDDQCIEFDLPPVQIDWLSDDVKPSDKIKEPVQLVDKLDSNLNLFSYITMMVNNTAIDYIRACETRTNFFHLDKIPTIATYQEHDAAFYGAMDEAEVEGLEYDQACRTCRQDESACNMCLFNC